MNEAGRFYKFKGKSKEQTHIRNIEISVEMGREII
jgi:hypothetical protein